MESALYYTLSTIAQALAGALAVPVAFVVFWLSNVDSDIRQGKSLLSTRFDPADLNEALTTLCERGPQALDDFFRRTWKAPAHEEVFDRGDREICAATHAAYQKRPRVTSRLYTALGCSSLTIALCFAALPFTPALSCYHRAAAVVLFAAVGLGLVCLVLYVRLILALVRA